MTNVDSLWLDALQDVIGRAAHEVKDSLNGVSLNLEVIRSRTSRPPANGGAVGGGEGGGATDNGALKVFSTAAVEQLELLAMRTEAVLFLARPARATAQTDVAAVLQHLACLLIPATKADGGRLLVEGYQNSAPTSAPAKATRLALARALLGLTSDGQSGQCRLDATAEPAVRFSHESARPYVMDAAVTSVLAGHSIRVDRSGSDMIMIFPR